MRDVGIHELATIDVQLTYYQIDTDEIKLFCQTFSREELADFYQNLLKEYSKWLNMSTILANITYTGDGYIKIKSTDAVVKLSGVVITPIHYTNLTPNIKNEVGSGTYLIGIDINPGTYKIEPTAGSGKAYYARLSSVSMDENDIIKYEFFKNTETITILPTDVAIHIQGAKLTLQK